MTNKVETFVELIQTHGHTLSELGFSSGASEKEIKNIEIISGQIIPDELKLFLSKINGQNTEDFYFLPDQVRLFSCQEIVDEWKQEQEYAQDTTDFYEEFQDDNKIRCTIYHKTRIPFAGQEGFGVICIDNDPGPSGKIGQIIYLINECDFIVLADSFKEFIDLYVDKMQKRLLKFEEEEEGYPNKFRLKFNVENMNGLAFVEAFRD